MTLTSPQAGIDITDILGDTFKGVGSDAAGGISGDLRQLMDTINLVSGGLTQAIENFATDTGLKGVFEKAADGVLSALPMRHEAGHSGSSPAHAPRVLAQTKP